MEGLSHPARRRMCLLYIAGLIGPGDRKDVQPVAARSDVVDQEMPVKVGLRLFLPETWTVNPERMPDSALPKAAGCLVLS